MKDLKQNKTKLSTARRHKIYKDALKLFIEHSNTSYSKFGLCYNINRVTRYDEPNVYQEPNEFPEFWFFRPKENQKKDSYWYFGSCSVEEIFKLRKKILEFCIEMTNP